MKKRLKILALALLIVGSAAGVSISYNDPSPSGSKYMDCPAYATNQSIFMSANGMRAAQVTPALAGKSGDRGVRAENQPRNNYIDDEIFNKMSADQVPSAEICSDDEFIRRVNLDLTGRIPSAQAVLDFRADTSETKRADLINRLIGTPEFVDKWTVFLGDLFKNTYGNATLYYGSTLYYEYLREALETDKGWDQIANELLTVGTGANNNSWLNGRTNFFARAWEPMVNQYDVVDNIAVDASRIFLGVPDLCISCHSGLNHLEQVNLYLSRKRRQDLWGLSAFFSELRFQRQRETTGPNTFSYRFNQVATEGYDPNLFRNGGIRPQRSGGVVTPNYFLIEPNGQQPKTDDWRAEFSRILREDPQFGRSIANNIWKEMFSMGIVDPPDAFDLARQDPRNPPPAPWTIQPTHPDLLNRLGADFAANGYKLSYLIKLMANSTAYQLSAKYNGEWRGDYAQYFARRFAKRMTAEQLLDAVYKATGIPGDFSTRQGVPVQWAMQFPDPTEPVNGSEAAATRTFLNIFFRGNRFNTARTPEGSTLQALALMNNALIQNRVRVGRGGLVDDLLAGDLSTDEIISKLFLTVLSRDPSAAERDKARTWINANRNNGTEDLMLVLLSKLDGLFY